MNRWTLTGYQPPAQPGKPNPPGFKLFLHHFFRRADDRDVHDHPCAFFTLCLFGSYEDMQPCGNCNGRGWIPNRASMAYREDRDGRPYWIGSSAKAMMACPECQGSSVVVADRVRFGSFRYRPAEHTHRTKAGRFGAWTIVLMLPKSRRWGFYRAGRWWTAAEYEAEYGPAMRCE